MNRLTNSDIVLSGESSIRFIQELLTPDPETLSLRDDFLSMVDSIEECSENGCLVYDIPDLDLDFLNAENSICTVMQVDIEKVGKPLEYSLILNMDITIKSEYNDEVGCDFTDSKTYNPYRADSQNYSNGYAGERAA